MNEQSLERKIIEIIGEKRDTKYSFEDMIRGFEDKFNQLNPVQNCINIKSFFGKGKGKVTSRIALLEVGKIDAQWLKEDDFKGLYVFVHNDTPFYVGISRGVIKRIHQHVKGKNHFTSTLAFKIAQLIYTSEHRQEFEGLRKDFDFKGKVEPVKQFLMKQKVAFIHIEDDNELALFEIYCSMKLETSLNTFKTH
jgi:predicted GIY-YIG superfamily endonuclease